MRRVATVSASAGFVLGASLLVMATVNGVPYTIQAQDASAGAALYNERCAVCHGGAAPGTLDREWARIKLARSRLASPYSKELGEAMDDILASEQEIEGGLARREEPAALDHLRDYFRMVATAFRNVDGSLKQFCLRLGAVSQPLKTVLEMC